jgi:outer membrane protein assembly factor BamB
VYSEPLPLRCIGNLPKDPHNATVQPLDAGLAELWRVTLQFTASNPQTVLVGNRVVVSAGQTIHALSPAGSLLWQNGDFTVMRISGPTADPDGNIYYAGSSIRSVDPQGATRWTVPLGPNLSVSESHYTKQLLYSPDGGLYVAASDGCFYALNAEDGAVRWKREGVAIANGLTRTARLGVGDTVFLDDIPYDAATGEPSGNPVVAGLDLSLAGASYDGLMGYYDETVGANDYIHAYFIDFCMLPVWSLANKDNWRFKLAGFGNALVVQHHEYPAQDWLLMGSDGGVMKGPTTDSGFPATIGADGTIYMTRCTDQTGAGNYIVAAYSSDLAPLWTLDVGPPCWFPAAPALADDGEMYLVRDAKLTEVIAIQTQSPGLARVAMPTPLFNNRRTGWLGSPWP